MTTTQTRTNNRKPAALPAAPEPEAPIEVEEAPVAVGPSPMRLMHRIQGRIVGMLDRTYGDDDESKRRVMRAVAALLGDSSMPTT